MRFSREKFDQASRAVFDLKTLPRRLARICRAYPGDLFERELIDSLDSSKSFANLQTRLEGMSDSEEQIACIKRYFDLNTIRFNLYHIHKLKRKSDIFFENRSLYAEIFRALTKIVFDILTSKGYGKLDVVITIILLGNIAREDWVTNEVDWTPVYEADSDRTSTGKHIFGYVQDWKMTMAKILESISIRSHVERINTPEGTISDYYCHMNLKYPGVIQATKMLNARYLTGHYHVANFIIHSAIKELLNNGRMISEAMVQYWTYQMPKLDEINCVHPNLKGGYGRLRWINQICWLGRLLYNIEEMNSLRVLKSLHACGIVSTSQEHILQRAFIFFTEAMYHLYLLDYDEFTLLPEPDTDDMAIVCEAMGLANYAAFEKTLAGHTYDTCRVWQETLHHFIQKPS